MQPRKEQIGSCELYLGDCREVLPSLGKVDAVVTDIPYGEVNRSSGGLRELDKGVADVETFDLSFVIEQSSRIAETVYIFCGTEQVSELRAGFVRNGLTTRLCVWEKTNPSPMNGQYLWLSSIECCVFARKSGAYFAEHCASAVWRGPTERNQVHRTQKPEWLLDRIVTASVPEFGTCVDFTMGSGTTGVACVRLGRRFIGCEIEPKYFDIACRRIEKAYEDQRLFADPPKEPTYEQRDMFAEVA